MNKQQLTPFEQAAKNREQGMKRLAGIIITQAWIERLRVLRAAKITMTVEERQQWHAIITQAATAQMQHFGYDA
tara:strand:- start:511 stop:732 length:222 start_codon:yes stop_codon:yes gene_type:complete